MCSGIDIVKQGGFYVCQNCGMRYKDDVNDKIENWRVLAKRAKDDKEFAKSAEYYEMILSEDPNDWEAYFYYNYTKQEAIEKGRFYYFSLTEEKYITLFRLIDETLPDAEEKKKAIETIKFTVLTPGGNPRPYYWPHYDAYADFYKPLLDVFGDDELVMNPYVVVLLKDFLDGAKESLRQKELDKFTPFIKKYDSSYVAPKVIPKEKPVNQDSGSTTPSPSSGGGCYVATCVYGSYDCPQVWTLRRYRDYNLAETWYGRAFIRLYYSISPTLVKWFGEKKWFKRKWRSRLDKMVERLQGKGYESTPYEDRDW